jgi:hypothetical protein
MGNAPPERREKSPEGRLNRGEGGYRHGMSTVTPERPQPAPAPPPPAPPQRGFPWGVLAALVAVIVLLVGVRDWLPDLLPSIPNPFAEETVDRSRPAVLQSIRDLREYHASSGHFEVIVDLEKDTPLPAPILGTRTLFVAVGDVDAVVDFGNLGGDAVDVDDERRSARITLPPPRLSEARLDLDESYVYDRQEGILNEIGGLFNDESSERELYLLAEDKLDQAARDAPEIRRRAEDNTRAMLESLLRSLGFDRVTVVFEERD